jgi:hypothetical protein
LVQADSTIVKTSNPLVAAPAGGGAAKTTPATSFADSNTTQVVSVLQNGNGDALTASTNGTTNGKAGVRGLASATTGSTIGVSGQVNSPNGIAGLFLTTNASGKILSGLSGATPGTEKFSVDGNGNITTIGNVSASSFIGDGSHLTGIPAGAAADADTVDKLHAIAFALFDHVHTVGQISDAASTLTSNTFRGNQTITGNLNLIGSVSGSSANFNSPPDASTDALVVTQSTLDQDVKGVNASIVSTHDSAAAVYGHAEGGSGRTFGVSGENVSPEGIGVSGQADSETGSGTGVRGTTKSIQGEGVMGLALDTATGGAGVWGGASATSGNTTGISGNVASRDGVAGRFTNSGGGTILAETQLPARSSVSTRPESMPITSLVTARG